MKDRHEIINDVTKVSLNGIEYSAIIIGPEKSGVPKHILQMERQKGMVIDGQSITPFAWKGVIKDDTYQYVYFEKANLEPLECITTKYRSNALKLIEEIAFGLNKASKEFLDTATGVFPLYRIYIQDSTKIVLLPPDMGSLLEIARMGERRENEGNHLIKKNTEKGFLLIQEMVELMYWSATGRLPYENKDVRTCDYEEVPIDWYEANLDEKTEGFINFVLHVKERQMRDIAGNRKANDNLSWFLNRIGELEWNLNNITLDEREERAQKTENSEEFNQYFEKIEKKAKKRNFWRVKGTIIISISVVVAILATIVGTILYGKFEPPYTRDMDQVEIIEDFFNNMNKLDPAALGNNAIKVDPPQYNAVMSLYVTKQTRSAYEMNDPAVNLDWWLDNGKPAIEASAFIYGADIDSITQIDEDTFRASGTWYAPYREKEELDITPPEGYTVVYTYDVDEEFTFSWSKRGWWVVDDIQITKYDYTGYELVETYQYKTATQKLLEQSSTNEQENQQPAD